MRTSTILWPEADLGCPLRSSWSASVKARFASGVVNAGITTYAGDRIEEVRVHECGFVWSQAQLGIFETFHGTTLLRGMRWFMMDFLVGGVMVPCYSHITGGYRLGDEDGHVTANMTITSFRRTGRETG